MRYRDAPDNPFDWGDGEPSSSDRKGGKTADRGGGDTYHIDDSCDFAPVSLHDEDDSDDDDNEENATPAARVRNRANKLLNERIFDETTYDAEDDRIFVGGGW